MYGAMRQALSSSLACSLLVYRHSASKRNCMEALRWPAEATLRSWLLLSAGVLRISLVRAPAMMSLFAFSNSSPT
eukprot:scaffold628_cov401-Prasinococcus_capsulatus_cf.AAC.11